MPQSTHRVGASACPVCGGILADWVVKQQRQIQRCQKCALLWVPAGVAVGPSGASIYEEETPIFMLDGNADYYMDEGHIENFVSKLNWVEKYLPAKSRLLDAGANYGHFLKVASDRYDAVGFDISPAAVRWSVERFGVRNRIASIYDIPSDLGAPFDGVVSFDVIEHVPDPGAALTNLASLVKPGGLLFLSTPDAGSLVARLMGQRWHYLDPVQHIVLFNRANLTRLLRKTGFEPIAFRSVGHRYRLSYILDRLTYLHGRGMIGAILRAARALMRPFGAIPITLNLGDVMGVVARRTAP